MSCIDVFRRTSNETESFFGMTSALLVKGCTVVEASGKSYGLPAIQLKSNQKKKIY